MNSDKKEVINTVKQELEVLIEDCEFITSIAKHALEVFDDFQSEKTLNKLDLILDKIRDINNSVLNLVTVTKMSCLVVKKEKEVS